MFHAASVALGDFGAALVGAKRAGKFAAKSDEAPDQSRTPRSQTIGLSDSWVLLGAARAGHVERVVECSLQHFAEAFLRQVVHAG